MVDSKEQINEELDPGFKKKEIHKVALSAFVNNSFERDKVLLAISVAAIGYFVNFVVGNVKYFYFNLFALGFTLLISFCFLVTVGSIIYIFIENKRYLQNILKGNMGNSKVLEVLDWISLSAFVLGVFLSVGFSIIFILNYPNSMEVNKRMTNSEKIKIHSLSGLAEHATGESEKLEKSLNGLGEHLAASDADSSEGSSSDASATDKKE